ncbi:MAG: M28 family peptidase [Bacteroidota bacterium]|nr:M28 family peptidase [Bacteroidota bacterium]
MNIPKFDGIQAFAYLKSQTDFGARVPGSDAHKKCLNYLHLELQKYADGVTLQPFKHIGYSTETIQMTNIIASFNLKATTRILLLAHWDCRPFADQDPNPKNQTKPVLGANDAASGVAVLLEIARHLKQTPPKVGVDILFTDGEDYGKEGDLKNYLLGAKYFSKNLPQGFKPVFGILLDMVGDSQLEILKEPYSIKYAPDIVELVWSTAKKLNIYQFVDDVRQYGVIDDHLPLNEVGIKTINIIDFAYPDESNSYWHTMEDTPDKCSPESLEAVGKVILHVIYNYQIE